MMFKAALLLAVLGCVSAQNIRVQVNPCQDAAPTGRLLEVRVSECKKLPCVLRKGTEATIEMDFIPATGTNNVRTGAHGNLNGVNLPFVGTNGAAACSKITLKATGQPVGCDLVPGQTYTYSNSFAIRAIYPSTNVKVQWQLIDRVTRSPITCFTLPAKIA